ncbi:MAG: S-layer homology domain-containing protein, partial [Anaerovorax sp.]
QMILPPSAMMDLQKKGGTSFVIEMKDTKGQELSAEDQRIVGKRPMMTLDIRIDGKSIGNLGVPFFKGCIPYVRSTNENAGGLFAKYMGKDNQPHIVKMSMYDDKTKMVKFAEKQLGVYAVGYNEVTFSDIGTHWAKSNIEFLAARDMVKGRGENRFEANGKVTRAEFIKMLVDSIDGLDVSGSQSMGYTDVVPGSWYADYVNWAGKKEIVKGFEDGTFRPAQLITREQMAVMTASFIKAVHGELNFVNKKTA